MCKFIPSALCQLIAWVLVLSPALAALPEGRTIYRLDMQLAVRQEPRKATPGEEGALRDLHVFFREPEAGKAMATGFALSHSKGIHEGGVWEFTLDERTVGLHLGMSLSGDAWIREGQGQYQLRLHKEQAGRYVGTFEGTYDGRPVKGSAQLSVMRRSTGPVGLDAAGTREHPRLLFRAKDIQVLQQRMKSTHPVLQAAWKQVETSRDPVALGLRYQLTGDVVHAEAAGAAVRQLMADRNGGADNERGYLWADRLVSVSLAYDLCSTGWNDEFRRTVEDHLIWLTDRLVNRAHTIADRAYWPTYSRFVAHMQGGGSIGSLALVGHKGDEPREPARPEEELLVASAPADFKPGELQVQPLKLSHTPDWLATAPLDPGTRPSVVPSALGNAEVVLGDKRWPMTPVREDAYRNDSYTKGRVVDLGKLTDGRHGHVVYLMSVVKNDEPRYLRVNMNQADVQPEMLIGEPVRVLRHGDIVRLEAGVHPIAVRAELGKPAQAWAGIWVGPRFEQVTQEQAAEHLVKRKADYAINHTRWAHRHALWRASDGSNPVLILNAERAMYQMIRFYQSAYGTGGYQVEGEESTLRTMLHPLEYELAFRMMYDSPVTPEADVEALAPRYLMTTIFSDAGAVNQSFSGSDGTMSAAHYARAWALTPEAYRPAVLWAWNRAMGLPEQVRLPDVRTALYTWLHYPVDGEPREPGTVMPRGWHAETKGLVVFRNRFKDRDDIVLQLHAKGPVSGGQHRFDAGSLRLHGLGHAWAFQGIHSPNQGIRQMEPVVHMPELDSNISLPGKITHATVDERTGSGSATVDLSLLFTNRKPNTSRSALVSLDGRILDEELEKTGIDAKRSVAVDYSGKSGSPAVFVVVDRITGDGKKVWHWQLPALLDPDGKPREDVALTMTANDFTVVQGDASLRGTFISPTKVNLAHEQGVADYKWYQTPKQAKMNALTATHAEGPASQPFICVFTLQRGEAPRITSERKGDGFTIRVGEQTIRIEGDDVRFVD